MSAMSATTGKTEKPRITPFALKALNQAFGAGVDEMWRMKWNNPQVGTPH